ncbi:MAG: hypothetical protein H6704_31075 [Myxococcales bacterium]|nr:hypothetical protein [Myxococcales bacterium]MCB9540685.1 hypothetical protein [Myxococcales bacterium]
MRKQDGPGLWWQFLEFMGMTWPGHKQRAAPEAAPRCSACGNPAERDPDTGAWRCPVHTTAELLPTP